MLVIALGDLGFVGPLNIGLTLLADERGWEPPAWAGYSPVSGPAPARPPCC